VVELADVLERFLQLVVIAEPLAHVINLFAAQAELAYLRTYSDVYRAHLKAYTEGILRGIEEWERKEAISIEDATQMPPIAALPMSDGNAHHR